MRKEIFDGRYSVDTEGNVYGPNGIKSLSIINGYYRTSIKKPNRGGTKGYKVHRLVAEAFIPNPDNKPQVNHIDGNKLNNRVENLEWVTGKENMEHAIDTGLFVPNDYSKFGYVNPGKLNFEKVKEIRELHSTGKYTHEELCNMYGIGRRQISKIVNNHNWKV